MKYGICRAGYLSLPDTEQLHLYTYLLLVCRQRVQDTYPSVARQPLIREPHVEALDCIAVLGWRGGTRWVLSCGVGLVPIHSCCPALFSCTLGALPLGEYAMQDACCPSLVDTWGWAGLGGIESSGWVDIAGGIADSSDCDSWAIDRVIL